MEINKIHNENCLETISNPLYLSSRKCGCVDTNTEILTSVGWKKYFSVKSGDKCLSYNINKNIFEWKDIGYITYYFNNDEAYHFNGRRINFYANANHNNIIVDRNNLIKFKRTAELLSSDEILVSAKLYDNEINHKRIDKNIASLIGWFLTEGYIKYSGKKELGKVMYATIDQSLSHNPKYVDEIRNLLKLTGSKYIENYRERPFTYDKTKISKEKTFHIRGKIRDLLISYMRPNLCLDTDILSWNIESLRHFFDASIKGDGSFSRWKRGGNGIVFKQTKNDSYLNLMQIIGCLLGYNTYLNKKSNTVEFFPEKSLLIRNKSGKFVKKINNYNGIMWCPHVKDNASFVARNNGHQFITGNTFPEYSARIKNLTPNLI